MGRVFISYRRADSASWATKLNEQLGLRYGKDLIFQDVDDIEVGKDYLEIIRHELESSQVFLILIGKKWLVDPKLGRRLDDPKDVLRMEIKEALSSEGTTIPVLVDGAKMPSSEDLPRPLKPLSRRNAAVLSPKKWRADVKVLLEKLTELVLPKGKPVSVDNALEDLSKRQNRYFELLESNKAAEALEVAQKAQHFLDQVMPLYPQDPDLKITRGYLFKDEAMALIDLERFDESEIALNKGEVIFRTMIFEIPRDAGAWNGLGSIEAVRGNFERAHGYIDKALHIMPDYPEALTDHANVLQRLGRTKCKVLSAIRKKRQ